MASNEYVRTDSDTRHFTKPNRGYDNSHENQHGRLSRQYIFSSTLALPPFASSSPTTYSRLCRRRSSSPFCSTLHPPYLHPLPLTSRSTSSWRTSTSLLPLLLVLLRARNAPAKAPRQLCYLIRKRALPFWLGSRRVLNLCATSGPPNHWNLKGRHVGRTIHTFVNIGQLITSGMQLDKDLSLLSANEIEKYPAQYVCLFLRAVSVAYL